MNSVQTKVAEQLGKISEKVETSVVDVFVKRELDKRSTALVQVLDTLDQLERDLKKIKPDMVFYSEAGVEEAASYSKAKNEEKKKLQEKIGKYTKAIEKALDKGDFGDVYNLKNQGKGGSGAAEAVDTEDT